MKPWRTWAPLVGALGAAALVQAGALRAPFFADDWLFLDQVRQKGFLTALMAADPIGNFFRPLGRVTWFWILGRASGESAFVFHAGNLALWVISVGLLWAIARRLAGDRVAAVAAALFALTQAADVPVLWSSGSQDLLALALALGAVLAFLSGRRWAAAVLLCLAPLAKETIAVAIIPAALLARRPREPWSRTLRRAAPLGMALAVWAVIAASAIVGRHSPASGLVLSPWGLPAALYNAARSAIGLEWRAGSLPWVPFAMPGALEGLALLLAAIAAGWLDAPAAARPRPEPGRRESVAKRRGGASASPTRSADPVRGASEPAAKESALRPEFVAMSWVLPGLLPVVLVAPLWSSYYFLFAFAGLALGAGLLLARASRLGVVTVVLALGLGMQQARALTEFASAPSPWSAQSHVNRFYLLRGMSVMSECVADMRRKLPSLPHRSTVYFSQIPAFSAVQVADGPLVRGVYRDTSLRSYYISTIDTEALSRGPHFILWWDRNRSEFTDRTNEADLWAQFGLGFLLNGNYSRAVMAFQLDLDRNPGTAFDAYGIALARAAMGDSADARRRLVSLGFALERSAGSLMSVALAQIARGDTAGAIATATSAALKAVYDPRPHLFLGVLFAADSGMVSNGILESCAAVVLAPGAAPGWKLWAAHQGRNGYEPEALKSLERYFKLDPQALVRDGEARAWRDSLRERLPGGRIVQVSLKDGLR